MLDILIRNAKIVDGTGAPAFYGSVGARNGKIVLNPPASETAARTIDAQGFYVSPGFIDAHSHGDLTYGQPFTALSKLCQGVTTQITGQCGQSIFPASPEHLSEYRSICGFASEKPLRGEENFSDLDAFLTNVKNIPLALNIAAFVGHNSLRAAVMGFAQREPSEIELERMRRILERCMQAGALGLSTGLIYMPGCCAKFDELAALVRVLAPYNGIYVTHMRNEADHVTDAVAETLALGKQADVPVWISHHKVAGVKNWGRSAETLRLIDAALASGQCVTLDQYPFTASMTTLDTCFPSHRLENGVEAFIESLADSAVREQVKLEMQTPTEAESTFLNVGSFDRIQIAGSDRVPRAEGLRVSEYARFVDKDPFDALFDLFIKNRGNLNGIFYSMRADDVVNIFQHPRTCIGSDGITRSPRDKTHPRAFATFPHAIRYFVAEKGVVTLEECVRKATGLTASALGFQHKGVIADGMDADLVVFDFDRLDACADFDNPTRTCDGILHVLVGGKVAYENGRLTGTHAGRFIKRGEA